jgi:hypothetical protein
MNTFICLSKSTSVILINLQSAHVVVCIFLLVIAYNFILLYVSTIKVHFSLCSQHFAVPNAVKRIKIEKLVGK